MLTVINKEVVTFDVIVGDVVTRGSKKKMAIALFLTKVEYIIVTLATKEQIGSTLPLKDKYYNAGQGQNGQ